MTWGTWGKYIHRRWSAALRNGESIEEVQPIIAAEIPGARAVYACTEHDDCREHAEVGVACWRERHEETKR